MLLSVADLLHLIPLALVERVLLDGHGQHFGSALHWCSRRHHLHRELVHIYVFAILVEVAFQHLVGRAPL